MCTCSICSEASIIQAIIGTSDRTIHSIIAIYTALFTSCVETVTVRVKAISGTIFVAVIAPKTFLTSLKTFAGIFVTVPLYAGLRTIQVTGWTPECLSTTEQTLPIQFTIRSKGIQIVFTGNRAVHVAL